MNKNTLQLLVLMMLSFTSWERLHGASEAEFAKAINVAGRQRMLSQKMAKEAMFIHLKVNEQGNRAALKKTMSLFDNSLSHLISGSSKDMIPQPPGDKIKKQLEKVKGMWGQYKKALDAMDLPQIAKLSLPILKNMNRAVKMYEVESVKAKIKGKGKVINVAGRQRMLTQKMAKEVLFLVAAKDTMVDRKKMQKQLASTQNLFKTSLGALMNGNKKMRIAKSSKPEIQAQLKIVATMWVDYQKLIDQGRKDGHKLSADNLAKLESLSPQILKEMNKAVGMYE